MRIAVDVLGGDHAPDEILKGVAEALLTGEFAADELLLVGPRPIMEQQLGELGVESLPHLLHTEQVIEGHEKPVEGLRSKPEASIVLCVGAVREKKADGLIAFGNTGATVAAATMGLGMLPGIRRPGIAVVLHGRQGPFTLLDAGANPAPSTGSATSLGDLSARPGAALAVLGAVPRHRGRDPCREGEGVLCCQCCPGKSQTGAADSEGG